MHKASRVLRQRLSATPEGGEDKRPTIPVREPAAAAEDCSRQPKGQRDSGHPQKRAWPRWGASNEGATSSGRKKTGAITSKNPRRTEKFSSCQKVERTGDQQRVPGRQNSNSAPLVDEQRTTWSSVRHAPSQSPAGKPGTEATRRRRCKTKPSKQHPSGWITIESCRAQPNPCSRCRNNRSYPTSWPLQVTTGGNEEAALPTREETLQPHFRDNGRLGDNKRPHILPHLTPGSPAAHPIPLADRGEQRPPPWLLAVTKTARGIAWPLAVTATPWRAS